MFTENNQCIILFNSWNQLKESGIILTLLMKQELGISSSGTIARSWQSWDSKERDVWQVPTVQLRELCSIFCNNLIGKTIWKRIDACIYIIESLCHSPETNTIWSINSVCVCYLLNHVQLLVTSKTVACQAPLSMGCPRQENWSGYSLLQGIFLTQGSNLGLLHCRWINYAPV